jgi:hypothetical protein
MGQTVKASFKAIEHGSGEVEVLFNPEKVSVKKQVDWKEQKHDYHNVPTFQFKQGKARTLDMTLIFDTTGKDGGPGDAEDVRGHTKGIEKMAFTEKPGKEDKQPPPTVLFQWGQGLKMTGVIKSVNTTYTKFRSDGIPVRAEVQVQMIEIVDPTKGGFDSLA